MSKLKGVVKIEFVDVETGNVNRVYEKENFIFYENYPQLWTSVDVLQRPVIVNRGADIYPMLDKHKNYYGRDITYLTGYAPSGTSLKKFFQKTENSPAYWDFYSLFLPPAVMSSIPCIALSTSTSDNYTPASTVNTGNTFWTALNLDPYCYQSPTEYMNIYYRLIMIEDDRNNSTDFVRNQIVLDIDRGANKVIFPNVTHKFYPFRIKESLDRGNKLNFVSNYYGTVTNKDVVYPALEHGKLMNAQKTYGYPDESPNQYTQLNYGQVNTLLRGTGSARLLNFNQTGTYGIRVAVNPIQITSDIAIGGATGIGNVFASSGASSRTIFDAANFPAGSGRMQVSGRLNNDEGNAFEVTYQAEVTVPAQSYADATYRLYEYSYIGKHYGISSVPLVLLPHISGTSASGDNESMLFGIFKELMYTEPSKIHFSKWMIPYVKNRSFITWDTTGVMLYDIYEGTFECYDATTPLPLNVTNVIDVKVDAHGNIWVACSMTGLWKISFDIVNNTSSVTHIGVLPGSEQKCYAIETDNFGNIFAIFWGTGLFYSMDQGTSWVNAIINYAPFSGYEAGGFVSKWSYVGRLICNKDRNVALGTAQLLILMKPSGTDYATSAGCWYDQQSQITTGIVNTTIKTQLAPIVNNRYAQTVEVSDHTNTWFFLTANNTLRWLTYQQTEPITGTTYTNADISARNGNLCMIRERSWSPSEGRLKDYLKLGVYGSLTQSPTVTLNWSFVMFDIESKTPEYIHIVPQDTEVDSANAWNASEGYSWSIGPNMLISYMYRTSAGSGRSCGWFVHHHIPYSKEVRQWGAKNYGWNGTDWVENFLGNKPIHLDYQPLLRGVENKFTDGNPATQSWAVGDTFTVTCVDGFFKDNSSTMAIRDTVYYKPTDTVEAFEPEVVSWVNGSPTGFVNDSPIELDWNIDDLPDTTYTAGTPITNGDPFFNTVTFMALFNSDTGMDVTYGGAWDHVIGAPVMDDTIQIFGDECVRLDGSSGFTMVPSTQLSLGGRFTVEMTIVPEITGSKQYLLDFRTTTSNAFSFFINATGTLGIELGSNVYGNVGEFLQPGTQYALTIQREIDVWTVFVNGVLQFTFNSTANFAAEAPLHLFKRYQTTANGWEGYIGWAGNIRFTKAYVRYDANNVAVPTAPFPYYGNSYGGASMRLSGNYNTGSLVSKRELVGDWQVVFRGIDATNSGYRRSRPLLACGVSVLKFIESPTDISYRYCGNRIETFMTNHTATPGIVVPNLSQLRITKTGDFVTIETSIDGGANWVLQNTTRDVNPLHHIAMWQVQANDSPLITPSVEITRNGSAIFSKIGTQLNVDGYFDPKFLAADVYAEQDVKVALNDVPVSKVRSNYMDPALPLAGEVLAMQGGTLTFHPDDLGKHITGRIVTIRD